MSDEVLIVYAVRQSSRVAGRIEAEHQRQEEKHGAAVADEWEDGLTEFIASLATYPKRGATWRILFTVDKASENDPPTVQLQMLRHGAEAPMTFWPAEDE